MLVLHFDVNETILIGDPAGGDTFEDCLNKIICKVAFVKKSDSRSAGNTSKYTWHDGSPLDLHARSEAAPPPLLTEWEWPKDCCPFYQVTSLKSQFAKNFTCPGSPGSIYRGVYDELEAALRLPVNMDRPIDPRLSHDGVHHYLIPAFFHTLSQLAAQGRDFAVVIRTFGTDGPLVAAALAAWADGAHILPGVPALRVSSSWQGRYDAASGRFAATRVALDGDEAGAAAAAAGEVLDEEALLERIESGRERCILIADDYRWWRDHGYAPAAGKPLWLTLPGEGGADGDGSSVAPACHHVFFDDNIHNRPPRFAHNRRNVCPWQRFPQPQAAP